MGQGLPGLVTRYLLHQLRQWDVISANRVDYFIANSRHTARRIWRCYRREAQVIYPPVNIERFPFQSQKQDFYLTVSRLVSYKQVRLIVQAFNQLGLPLVVIGDGPEMPLLQSLAQSNIQLLGNQPNSVVEKYMAEAKAFVYAACEDFGIALVEAQACGTPVIAYGRGGALETVKDLRHNNGNGTGLFFSEQTAVSLVQGVETFSQFEHQVNPERCRQQAIQFSTETFTKSYQDFVEQCCQAFFS